MRVILTITVLGLLLPHLAWANDHHIQPGTVSTVPVSIDYLRETMVVLPQAAVSVTGAGPPAFQVEAGGDYIMVRALTPQSKGNIFVNFGNRTIVSLVISTVGKGGEEIVTLKFGSTMPEKTKETPRQASGSWDLRQLAGEWKVVKLKNVSESAGIEVKAHYAIRVGDELFLNLSIRNSGRDTFTISRLEFTRRTWGGFKGTTVLESEDIPSQQALSQSVISRGDESVATVVLPAMVVDFDQSLIMHIQNENFDGPELEISL